MFYYALVLVMVLGVAEGYGCCFRSNVLQLLIRIEIGCLACIGS